MRESTAGAAVFQVVKAFCDSGPGLVRLNVEHHTTGALEPIRAERAKTVGVSCRGGIRRPMGDSSGPNVPPCAARCDPEGAQGWTHAPSQLQWFLPARSRQGFQRRLEAGMGVGLKFIRKRL